MDTNENSTLLLLDEMTELLEEMILELELRGCQNHDPIIKHAVTMQAKIELLHNN